MLAAALPACAVLPAVDAPNADARGTASPCDGAKLVPSAGDAPAVEAATLCLVDRIRAAHHLPRVRANARLAAAAAGKLAGMVRWNYFADVGPDGQTALTLISSSRYARAANVAVGQNIAWGSGAQSTPANIVSAWMASPPHRAVLLRHRFRDAGVAVSTALPAVLGDVHGAIYALELAGR